MKNQKLVCSLALSAGLMLLVVARNVNRSSGHPAMRGPNLRPASGHRKVTTRGVYLLSSYIVIGLARNR
jgi:hypothetical protein